MLFMRVQSATRLDRGLALGGAVGLVKFLLSRIGSGTIAKNILEAGLLFLFINQS